MIDYDKEDNDPIVAEVRRAREQMLAEASGDLDALFENARLKTNELARQGWKVVSQPMSTDPQSNPTKKKAR